MGERLDGDDPTLEEIANSLPREKIEEILRTERCYFCGGKLIKNYYGEGTYEARCLQCGFIWNKSKGWKEK